MSEDTAPKKKVRVVPSIMVGTIAAAGLYLVGEAIMLPNTNPTSANYAVRAPLEIEHPPHTLPEDSVDLGVIVNEQLKNRIDSFQIKIDPGQADFLRQYDEVWCRINAGALINSPMSITINSKLIGTGKISPGPNSVGGTVEIFGKYEGVYKRLYTGILKGK